MDAAPDFHTSPVPVLPARTAWAWNVVPLPEANGPRRIGALDPDDAELRANLTALLGAPVELVRLAGEEIAAARTSLYGTGADELDDLSPPAAPASSAETDNDSAVARFVGRIISQARAERATDIHIEPGDGLPVIRLRIDGLLQALPVPPALAAHLPAVVSRIKILAGMNIAEKRLPQDGHFATPEIDVRVSTIPTVHGETVDLRLLPRGQAALQLESLGMAPEVRARVAELIRRPNGILLVTGPTGHGKTTTLYACLSRINRPEQKIITIEDPVEHRLRGVNQIQVNPGIGLTFASGLRAVLRQDPDVLMVGEIRDADTAEVAIRSSLTGHLVFSTLHTNDAVSAVARLMDMGIEPYLVAASLNAVLAQRLVRRICDDCAARGCGRCRGAGLRGRTGIFELFRLNDDLREMIASRASAADLRKAAAAAGMRTLFDDGRRKAADGATTLDEVRRVTEEA